MKQAIFLLRGVNVTGRRPLKMTVLKNICEGLGFSGVRTYLQSGNAVCRVNSRPLAGHAVALERRIAKTCGFEVDVAALDPGELAKVVASNPFMPSAGFDARFLYVTFLIRPPKDLVLDARSLPDLPGERALLSDGCVYLHCPKGYGVAKLNNTLFERVLRVRATTRNWRTVNALLALARDEVAPD